MKNVYKVKFICWLPMLMGGCQSIHQPLVCLSVPPTVRRHFDCLSTNRLSPFYQSTARLSVHPSVYPLLFFSTSLVVSTAGYPSIPPTVHLSVCLSVCLSSLVFPPTVNRRFVRRLCVYSPAVCHHFWRRLSAGAGCGLRRTRRGDSKKWLRFTVLARLLCFMH